MDGKVALVTGAAGGIGSAIVPPFTADVSRPSDVAAVVDDVERQIGPIHFLVNAAGILRLGTVDALTDDDWTTTLAINATGVFLMSRAAVSRMKTRGAGAIVTVASNAVVFLLSDRAGHITMHDLTVDGGAALGV